MNLISYFVKRSMLVNLLTVVVLVAGVMAALNMRREAFPAVDFDVVSIVATYPGASPHSVEKYIAAPIEREIKAVEGIKHFVTRNIEGVMIMIVTLDPDLGDDKAQTVTDMQRALDQVDDLPDDMLHKPVLKELSSEMITIVEVVLSGDMPFGALHKHAKDLIERLENIPDVSSVHKWGFRDKEFWVVVQPDKIQEYNLAFSDLSTALATANVTVPGGSIEGPAGEILVRTVGEVQNAKEIGDIVVRSNDAGVTLRIRDVARVEQTFEERKEYHESQESEAVVLKVRKSRSGDIIRLVDQVKEVTKAYETEVADGRLLVKLLNDQSDFVRNRLSILGSNSITGVILVLLTLLLFLSPGIAGVTALGLPVAFLGAMILLNYQGNTINLLSMFALVIVLGMVVDDAIIIAENIWSHYEQGKSPYEAAVEGTKEVFWPVTATIMTTLAAFSPMLMVSGIFGRFMMVLPLVVIACLGVSLLEAMFVLPAHAYDVLKWTDWRRRRKGSKAHVSRTPILNFFLKIYKVFLKGCLRFRYVFVPAMFGLLIYSAWLGKKMPLILFPSEGIEQFFLRVDFDEGTSLNQAIKGMNAFEKLVSALPKAEVKDYLVNVGIQQVDEADPFTQKGTHLAQLAVYLTPEAERSRTADEIIAALRPQVEQAAEKMKVPRTYFVRKKQGPPVGKPVAVRVTGPDFKVLHEISDKVMAKLQSYGGLYDISSNLKHGKKEAIVKVDHEQASVSLLSVASIAQSIRTAWAGHVASYVRSYDERIPIRVVYPKAVREEPQALEELKVANMRNQLVPLKKVASISSEEGLGAVFHYNGQRAVTVTSALDEKITSSDEVNRRLQPFFKTLAAQYPGYEINTGGEWEDTEESLKSLSQAFVIAIGLIYVVLATLFGSLVQPFVIMTAIPLAIIGVIWAFFLHQLPLSFFAMIGTIGLAGVVVNDSIVLVDFMNKAYERGLSAFEAAMEAGMKRFRAVWLTTLTTVFGLLPVVYGIGGMDKFLRPAAMALGYGLIFGTILVLLFIPAVAVIHKDIGRMGKRLFGG